MAQFIVKGVESIEFAPVSADGTLPDTGWVKGENIEMGSATLNIPEKTLTKVKVEDKAGIFAIVGEEGDGASVTAKFLNLDPKMADLVLKGDAASTATTKFEAPIDGAAQVNLAVRVTSKPWNGFKMVFVILNGSVIGRIENAMTKEGDAFVALGFTAEAQAVTNATGVAVSPWYYEKVAVA
ncbi:hypothetical protein [Sphingobacterium sp. UGAL515B_05]|uniref:hypothetical protein n=1 Tax=Sphingobacterium sp. UGAL515B_05 TaxID=2986767 RepID=UPI0029545D82|nr:hypothetical protein [Sphingobacterium sp. UGAL515B_05]WON94761.1 hypothetical protein OK025_26440 [Sphingobacterium sp. UGAL515B_05]